MLRKPLLRAAFEPHALHPLSETVWVVRVDSEKHHTHGNREHPFTERARLERNAATRKDSSLPPAPHRNLPGFTFENRTILHPYDIPRITFPMKNQRFDLQGFTTQPLGHPLH